MRREVTVDGSDDTHAAIAVVDEGIRRAFAALPADDDPDFWDAVDRDAQLPLEVLAHLVRTFHARGQREQLEIATGRLFDRAYPIAVSIIKRNMPSRRQDHDDAVNETFVTMWRHIAAGDLFWERNFKGALYAASISACRKYFAKKRVATPMADITHPPGGVEHDLRFQDDAAAWEYAQVLHEMTYPQAVARLDPPIREVWQLLTEEGLSQAEVAERLGCAKKTVYNRLGKAREQLAAFYGMGDDDGD